MAVSPFDAPMGAALFGDPQVSALFEEPAAIAAMVRVEAALARAEAAVGVIPAEAGARLAQALEAIAAAGRPTPESLAAGAGRAAVPVPALLAALRAELPPDLAEHLHFGATSQDIVDTGLVLRLGAALEQIDAQRARACRRLIALAGAHRVTPCLARSWSQPATPISFGLVAAGWLGPLTRVGRRLALTRREIAAVQFGGAVGSLAALGTQGLAVRDALAADLGLAPAAPWHTQRDRIGLLGGCCADLAAAYGRLGLDLSALAAAEPRAVRLGGGGGSSTMPQKDNPVGPQALVALHRYAAAQAGVLALAGAQAEARDGAAWMLEWLALPSLVAAVAGAARIGAETLERLEPDPAAMRAGLEATGGAVLAEAASFALAAHMPRAAAQALVKRAAEAGGPLLERLTAMTDAGVDWAALGDWGAHLGAADALIDAAIAEARALDG